jgi:hypothetical protein
VVTIKPDLVVLREVERFFMPKVFGLREVELRPGMEPDEYVRFFADEIASLPELPGWKTHLLKADRGAREGKLLILFEMDSVEARDRYFPRPNEESAEWKRYLEQHPEVAAAWEKSGISEDDIWTDYVVVAE